MIHLVSASIKNFRQLRNIDLQFAREPASALTVIRAENGTGKTNLLTALTWALFGDDALPAKRTSYRIHPLDWDSKKDGTHCPVEVTIKFATVDDETGLGRSFELVRSTKERPGPSGSFEVEKSELSLFETKPSGDTPISNPNAFISNRVLPTSLKDVFFIDGDRALAFIETTDERSAKRDRVEKAVRQLLGLDILEEAERHVDNARKQAVSAVRKQAAGTNLSELASREAKLAEEIQGYEDTKEQIELDRRATESRKRKVDEALKGALAAGGADRKQLEVDLTDRENELRGQRQYHKELVARQRSLVNSSDLLVAIARESIGEAGALLAQLENEGVIPDTLPEVVKDRLERGTCICGKDVSEGSEGHIALQELLGEVDRLEDSHEILLHLSTVARLHSSRTDASTESTSWTTQGRDSLKDIVQCEQGQQRLERDIEELRTKIREMPEQDLVELERMLTEEEGIARELTSKAARISEQIRNAEKDQKAISKERLAAQRKEERFKRLLADETAATDLLSVLRGTVETLEGETVEEVGAAMSEIFLNMIVADPEEGGLISRAELTREHDIVVYGSDNQRMDPDRDLSGAQRRALTLAFILALVRVSGVNAPNVVDTPLGMTSALVRRAMLQYAAENSSQLVMFLTSSEIHGVEDILDRYAGRTYTMTFSDHYPTQLVNDPGTGRIETLLCDCDYVSSCQLCARKEGV
ncbi:AAA family ATPase [Candidatus Poriferisocius sp.]|uniref:AAA family ATPase n=1 Tax=Candidatus Poriferisocius sp. TaxID=3101276 RepID=UPI003B01312C